nr:hypothetical protein CFP56_71355 [Quercus suber]
MNEDLWNIVETTTEPTTPAWSKKNAMALYLIRESCGSDRFSLIEKISKAKIAWDTLDPDSDLKVIYLDDVDKYNEWSREVKEELSERRQLWHTVEGTDEPPEAENDKALKVIGRECHNEFCDAIHGISSAKIAWYTLEAICTLPKTSFEFLAEDGDNYLDWSLQMKAILTDRQLWDIVEGTDDPPKAENDADAFKARSHENDKALGLIRYSCYFYGLRVKLQTITSAKIAWDALAAICTLTKNILINEESIAAVIECLESIPAVIKRLDDVNNYRDWSLPVENYLMNQQLWDIVEGTNEPPEAENDEAAFKAWSEKNAMALAMIMFSCGYRLRFAIWWITSAKIVWNTLAEIYEFRSYIVPEEYDYVAWSARMEDNLKAYDLWDIVEAATEPPKDDAWSKKNAKALYLIWESSDAFFSFKQSTRTAQIAWDTLAKFGNPGGIRSELRKYISFRQNLRKGNWLAANQFITSCPEAKSAIIANTGSTALHIAILAGDLNIVKELVNKLPTDKLLEIKDKDGNTVLGYCALVGNTEMARCIVDKCPNLLGIANGPHGLIPVVMALTHNSNSIAMAQYLISKTDLKILSPRKGGNGATFVTRCIYSKAFVPSVCDSIEMAGYALAKFPTLVTALDIENESPVLALASMSFAYTSGNQLRFWTRWIYNSRGSIWNLTNFLEINQIHELKLLHHQYKQLLLRMCEVLAG